MATAKKITVEYEITMNTARTAKNIIIHILFKKRRYLLDIKIQKKIFRIAHLKTIASTLSMTSMSLLKRFKTRPVRYLKNISLS